MKTIILNFDLNRTVLMSDAAGGRGMVDTLNYLLSEVSWGTVSKETDSWIPSSESVNLPSSHSPKANLISYKKYVDSKHEYIKEGLHTIPEGYETASAYNKTQKRKRKNLHGAFTNPSQPGHELKKHLNHLIEKMTMSTTLSKDIVNMQNDLHLGNGLLMETWNKGQHFLLPGFIKLLYYLQQNETIMKHVYICYRTFGNDLEEVSKELDCLCNGCHPLYPHLKLDERFRLKKTFSTFYRRGSQSSDCFFTYGTLERPNNITSTDDEVHTFYCALNGGGETKENISGSTSSATNSASTSSTTTTATTTATTTTSNMHKTTVGFINILKEIRTMVKQEPRMSIGIRDHWDYWSAHGESDDSGKPLLVDGSNEDIHVFIDDHVEDDHAHIIDVRKANDGSCVPFNEAINKYMIRAHPYEAITDENYFIQLLQSICEREWNMKIKTVEDSSTKK